MAQTDSGTREFGADQGVEGAHEADAPTRQFLAAPVSDRCASCGTPLAPDQHYCINCGERRGKPRFPMTGPVTQDVAYERVAAGPPLPPRDPRFASSSVFVTGVGVLLLAMGVGVLIGYLATKNNNGTAHQAAAAAPQVITVNGGGGGGGSSAPATAGGGHGGGKAARAQAAPLPKKALAKAQAAATKVLGASAKNLPPPTVTVGAKGHGPGYQGGHFTGNFFGGG